MTPWCGVKADDIIFSAPVCLAPFFFFRLIGIQMANPVLQFCAVHLFFCGFILQIIGFHLSVVLFLHFNDSCFRAAADYFHLS